MSDAMPTGVNTPFKAGGTRHARSTQRNHFTVMSERSGNQQEIQHPSEAEVVVLFSGPPAALSDTELEVYLR